MSNIYPETISRRRFVKGVAVATALVSSGSISRFAFANSKSGALTGTEFELELAPLPVNFTGEERTATVINGLLPGPVLRFKEGEDITIRVTNRLEEMTTIHWHGIILDADMDGVPGISFAGIQPGETFTHKFKAVQHGTYWYHAHTLHEQTGAYGTLIIEPKDLSQEPKVARDYPVLLSDWTDENPVDVFLNLKKMGGYYNYQQLTVGDFVKDVSQLGIGEAISKRLSWNKTRMSPADFSDVSAATYTYLMNGESPASNWTGLAKAGERVRLRFICAGTASYFDVRIPGLALTVISTDGQRVKPVVVDEFRIGPGETYDVIVQIPDDKAYTIFAQSMDRSGYARGTLSPREGLTSVVPALDATPRLEPIDMMGAMAQQSVGQDMVQMEGHRKVNHAWSEYGPGVDMRVDNPRTNLDDPGPGLRNNGRRVLTYADLKSIDKTPDQRVPSREIELHLTGNMERFIWSIDGLKLNEAKPLHFPKGERIRVILHNDTTMTHPMHLHGMWSDLESPDGKFQVRKHTISVQPAQSVSMLVTVDAEGRWAFHCHLLYHMAAGMFREVVVA
ncbi:MAG: copper resistance system multicopper oxidase [Gammaproteobacteria bacterium]|nr:copper resistance system multicopper oxidase [Gammaproteobacteria bacterium]